MPAYIHFREANGSDVLMNWLLFMDLGYNLLLKTLVLTIKLHDLQYFEVCFAIQSNLVISNSLILNYRSK